MDAIDCIMTRRSRRKYLGTEVPDSEITRLIDAARQAPFGGPPSKGPQVWEFVVVRGAETKKKLALGYADRQWVAEAPVIIACCADTRRDPDYKDWSATTALAVENLLLAAHALGLGACWVATFNYHPGHAEDRRALREALALPESIELVALVTLGYPDPAETIKSKELRELSEIAHKEKCGPVV